MFSRSSRFPKYHKVSPASKSIIEYYRVLQSITEYYRVLQSITKTNLADLLGPIFGLVLLRKKMFP